MTKKSFIYIFLIYHISYYSQTLNLNNPIYEITSAYGHFGRKPTNKGEFSWEKTDKTDLFRL